MQGLHALLVLLGIYQLVQLSISASCTNGYYGTSCNFTCSERCYLSSSCVSDDTSTGGCATGGCNKGFGDPPSCLLSCGKGKYVGFFGFNCSSVCHCKDNLNCDSVSGNCDCDILWFGAGCQSQKPRLRDPPQIIQNNCSGLTVQFSKFNKSHDFGEGDIVDSYYLQVSDSASNNWTTAATFLQSSSSSVFSKTFAYGELSSSLDYQFRVTCYYKKGYAESLSPPGNGTAPMRPVCTTTTAAPTTTPSTSSPTGFTVTVSGSTLKMTWTVTTGVQNLNISVTQAGIGDCSTVAGPTSSYIVPAVLQRHEFTGSNWTLYNISWVGLDSANRSSNEGHLQRTTQSINPTGAPQLTLLSINQTSLSYRILEVPCDKRGGKSVFYVVSFSRRSGISWIQVYINKHYTTLPPSVMETDLIPYTEYQVTVYFINENGKSSDTVMTNRTLAGQPAAPTNVAVANINITSAAIFWTPPNPPLADIKQYIVMLETSPARNISVGMATSYTFTGLESATTYSFRVAAESIDSVLGVRSNSVIFTTLPDQFQVGLLKWTSRTSSSVAFSWSHPSDVSGLSSYNITAERVESKLSAPANILTAVSETAGATSRTLSSLDASSLYNIYVTPVYSPVKSAKAVRIQVWTAPGAFAVGSLEAPVVVSTTDSTIDLSLKGIVKAYTGGQLTAYYIIIREKGARRRRALTPDTVGLPGGSVVAMFAASSIPTSFQLGDGRTYSGYTNSRLKTGTAYDVSLAATAELDSLVVHTAAHVVARTSGGASTTTPAPGTGVVAAGNNVGLIIGLVILFIIILILIVLILLFLYRRHVLSSKLDLNDYKFPVLRLNKNKSNNEPHSSGMWSVIHDVSDPRKLIVDPENLSLNQLSPKIGMSCQDEFKKLPHGYSPSKSCAKARMAVNLNKNQCLDNLPYDHTLVTLEKNPNVYVNASFVDGYIRRKGYIAAQSPMNKEEANHFWQMIYEQNVAQVVMLCEVFEANELKSYKYWPDVEEKSDYGSLWVKCLSEDSRNFFRKRVFSVKGMQVTQYQFLCWPERGVPESPLPLLALYTHVKVHARIEDGPLLVHCETGNARTAVFMAVDYLLQQAMHEQCVNVFRCVQRLRKSRANMVSTSDQYIFVYDALFEALLSEGRNIVSVNVEDSLKLLLQKNPKIDKTYLWEQFAYLEKYIQKPSTAVGARTDYQACNRDPSILPSDNFRVKLTSSTARYDYINAVWLDGFAVPEDIIVTQTPLPNTLGDLWQMVWEYKVTHLVDLQPDVSQAGQSFYPMAPHREITVGHFTVTRVEHMDGGPDILRVSSSQHSLEPLTVSLFTTGTLYSGGEDRKANIRNMFDAVESLLLSRQPRAGPYVLVCLNGASRCGLFAACMLCAQQLFRDSFTDVFHVVKWMKLRRPSLIQTVDQYRYIFYFLNHYSNKKIAKVDLRRSGDLAGVLRQSDPNMETIYSHSQRPVLLSHQRDWVPYHYSNEDLASTANSHHI